jgi:hypothetical protein
LDAFKEHLSNVAKFETTVLTPKGYNLSSDLTPVTYAYKAELSQVKMLLDDYALEENSNRWGQLKVEIAEKKAKLKVEGRTAGERAAEFANLNYLLEPRTVIALPAPKPKSNLRIRALAIEIELKLRQHRYTSAA